MSKIPNSAKKRIPRKCLICERKFISKEYLVNHIEKQHKEMLPEGWSASRYENYLRTGKTEGKCVVCHEPTSWNESTWKYNRLCGKESCRKAVSKEADKNMISKYGKTTLLNDAEQQRKMIYAKKTSGTYYWSTDTNHQYKMMYASKVEKQFLEMLDVFLNLEPEDVLSPSPNNYSYEYDGKQHLYIPDVYIPSINLEIELKEPKDNQNQHPKIQAVDKVKEKIKDDVMESIPYINYIKVNGSDYKEFFELFCQLKHSDSLSNNSGTKINQLLESVDIEDLDTEEIFAEMYQEPITENDFIVESTLRQDEEFLRIAATIQSGIEDVLNPELDYKRSLKKFDDAIKNCITLSDAKIIRKQIVNYRRWLKAILNNKDRTELHFEATRTLKELDKLDDKLDLVMRDLRKKGGQHFVTESHPLDSYVMESAIEGLKNNVIYKPVFVLLSFTGSFMANVIKGFTHGTYSHASISLDTAMKNMCSFNGHGFVDEDIQSKEFNNDSGYYALYMYMAPQVEYMTMENIISEFTNHRDSLKYSITGLINYVRGKESTMTNEWFCSEFVSFVLDQANPKLFNKHYSLYSPDDLTKTRKMIKISSGKTSEYDPAKIDRTIQKILTRKGYDNVIIKQK